MVQVSREVFSCSKIKVFFSSSTSHMDSSGAKSDTKGNRFMQLVNMPLHASARALKPGAGRPGRTRMKTSQVKTLIKSSATVRPYWHSSAAVKGGTLMFDAIHHKPGRLSSSAPKCRTFREECQQECSRLPPCGTRRRGRTMASRLRLHLLSFAMFGETTGCVQRPV